LKDTQLDTEQGVVKEDVGQKISANGRDYTSMCSKICTRQKTMEGRYACRPPFNWRMALE